MKKSNRKNRIHLLFAVNSLIACRGSYAFLQTSFPCHRSKIVDEGLKSWRRSTRDNAAESFVISYPTDRSRRGASFSYPHSARHALSSPLYASSLKNSVSLRDSMDSTVDARNALKMHDISMQMAMIEGEILNMRRYGSPSKFWYKFKSSTPVSTIRYEPAHFTNGGERGEHFEQTDFNLRAVVVQKQESSMNRNPNGMILHCSPAQDIRDDNEQRSEEDDNSINNGDEEDASFSKRFKDKFLGRIWKRKDEGIDQSISAHDFEQRNAEVRNPLSSKEGDSRAGSRDTSSAAASKTRDEQGKTNFESNSNPMNSPSTNINHSTLSLEAKSKEDLQRRLKLLLEQAGSSSAKNADLRNSLSSPQMSGSSSATIKPQQDAEHFSSEDERYASPATDVYQSSSGPTKGEASNQDQRELFLQKERELRKKYGLSGPSKLGKSRQSEQQQGNPYPIDSETKDERRPTQGSSDDKNDSSLPGPTTVTFDAFGSDPSLQDFKFKELSVNEARFRSFAPKKKEGDVGGGSGGDLKAFESFLKKESEMREKLRSGQLTDESEESSPNEAHSSTGKLEGDSYVHNKIDRDTQRPALSKEYNAAEVFKDTFSMERPSRNYYAESELSAFDRRRSDLMELTELSVEDLNFLLDLESPHLRRLISKNIPTADLGAIFRLESILVDTSALQFEAWQTTAKKFDFREPDITEAQRAVLMRPDVAVRDEFFWTNDLMESREIANFYVETLQEVFDKRMEQMSVNKVTVPVGSLLAEAKYDVRYGYEGVNHTAAKEIFPLMEGATEWLESLKEAYVPCALITRLDAAKMESVLNVTGLTEFFPPELRISAEAGYEWDRQEYLGACLRLSQRPEKCVVFEATPSSLRSAHEIGLKAVALMGLYPMYELSTADLAVSTFDELTIFNVRRIFGNTELDLETQFELEAPEPEVKRKSVRLWTEGDRD